MVLSRRKKITKIRNEVDNEKLADRHKRKKKKKKKDRKITSLGTQTFKRRKVMMDLVQDRSFSSQEASLPRQLSHHWST